jgi:hypothetical protein
VFEALPRAPLEKLGDFGALPQTPLKNFLKEVFKNFKNFYRWVVFRPHLLVYTKHPVEQ